MSRTRLLACILACLWSLSAQAELPRFFQAGFDVRSDGSKVGETNWSLRTAADGGYEFQSVSRATGLWSLLLRGQRTESSRGAPHDGRLRPLEYLYRNTAKKGREVSIHFDWPNTRARINYRGEPWVLPLKEGVQDKLVYILALMQDLEDGRSEMHYAIADGGRLKQYELKVLGRETIQVAGRRFDTVQVQRRTHKRTTTLWCAPELAYLPVRTRHRERDGDLLSMTLNRVSGQGLPTLDFSR